MDFNTVIRSVALTDMPVFVARDLSQLPPLTALNTDIMKLYKEVESLKHGLHLTMNCRESIRDLSGQMQLINQALSINP